MALEELGLRLISKRRDLIKILSIGCLSEFQSQTEEEKILKREGSPEVFSKVCSLREWNPRVWRRDQRGSTGSKRGRAIQVREGTQRSPSRVRKVILPSHQTRQGHRYRPEAEPLRRKLRDQMRV